MEAASKVSTPDRKRTAIIDRGPFSICAYDGKGPGRGSVQALVFSVFNPSPFEYPAAEQNEVHHREEYDEDNEREHRFYRRQGGQQHHREAEDYGREVLINQIVHGRGLEIAVYLTQEDDAGAGCAGQHAVHGEELLLMVFREQGLRH